MMGNIGHLWFKVNIIDTGTVILLLLRHSGTQVNTTHFLGELTKFKVCPKAETLHFLKVCICFSICDALRDLVPFIQF